MLIGKPLEIDVKVRIVSVTFHIIPSSKNIQAETCKFKKCIPKRSSLNNVQNQASYLMKKGCQEWFNCFLDTILKASDSQFIVEISINQM